MYNGKPTVLSLFCGAGGLDLGFRDAGFDIVLANDYDPAACETYAANIGAHVSCGEVQALAGKDLPKCDVVIGGPPCQGFSVAGYQRHDDPRSQLVWEFVRIVNETKPLVFVMENVKSLAANARWVDVRTELRREMSALGYDVEMHVLNASDFSVPQARERVFFIGTRDGVPPVRAVPNDGFDRVTVREVLEPLPAPGTAPNLGPCRAKVTPARFPVLRKSPYSGMLFNGWGRPIRLEGAANTLPASMGGNRTPILDELELREGKKPWIIQYHRRLMKGGDPVKKAPARLRRLSVTECARLQTFPAAFEFSGKQSAQFRQIGNAVPPRLALGVAQAVSRAMSGEELLADPSD